MPDAPSPSMLKKMKVDSDSLGQSPSNESSSTRSAGTSTHDRRLSVTVEEADENADQTFAPGGDADYFVEEDEEGRFFGGGLTTQQKEILNIFESASGEGVQGEVRIHLPKDDFALRLRVITPQTDILSITSIRRILSRFERAVNKNQEQRSKHPDDPSKYASIYFVENRRLIAVMCWKVYRF